MLKAPVHFFSPSSPSVERRREKVSGIGGKKRKFYGSSPDGRLIK